MENCEAMLVMVAAGLFICLFRFFNAPDYSPHRLRSYRDFNNRLYAPYECISDDINALSLFLGVR